MKIKNITTQSAMSIGIASLMLVSPSLILGAGTAQNSGVTFRPSLNGVRTSETTIENANDPASIAKKLELNARSLDALKLNIPAGVKDKLVEGMVTNKGLVSLVSSIARESAANVTSINVLRLQIASHLKNIDITDHAQIQKAHSDAQFQKVFHIAQLITTMAPRGQSTNTRANVEYFLKEILQLLEGRVPPHEVLNLVAETTLAEKGFAVDVDSISEIISKPNGVIGLFKGVDDYMMYDIGKVNGTPLTLRMTAKQLKEMEADVQSRTSDLVDLALNDKRVHEIFSAQSLKQLNSVAEDVTRFMKSNPILDATSRTSNSVKSETATVQNSITDLLRELQTLGVEIGGSGFKNKFQDVLRGIPLVGKALAPDRVDRIKTARAQIEEIDKALVTGANKMSTNNTQLLKMKSDLIAQRIIYQFEIARAKMSIELLEQYEDYYRSSGNTHVADIIKQDILLKLHRDFSASLILYGQMAIATASIDAMVSANEIIITNANDIRRVAIQAISVQETLKIANQQTKQVMLQQKAVQTYLSTLTVENVRLLRENAELLKQTMSTPMMEAAVIGKAIQDLVEIQNQSRIDRAKATEEMGRANQEMIKVVNEINGKLHLDPVGAAVNQIMNGERQNQRR